MSYVNSLTELTKTVKICGLSYTVDKPVSSGDRILCDTIFGSSLSQDIANSGYLGGLEVPWAAEDFFLYPLLEIESYQAGYRTDANTSSVSADWDQRKYVIGDWAANPVSIDQDGSIWYSRHGMGTWKYKKISESLDQFLEILGRWILFFVRDNNKNIQTENFEIRDDKKQEILDHVLSGMHPEVQSNFLDFIVG